MAKENVISGPHVQASEAPIETKMEKRSVASLSAAFFVDQSEEQALSILWPYMYNSIGASIGQLGPVLGASKFFMTMMFPVWGYASDRFSRKFLLVFFTGFWGLWTLGIGFAESLPQLFTLRIISGLGLGVFAPAAFSLISDLFDNESRGRATGLMRAIGMLGILVAIIMLPMLGESSPEGWRTGFIIMGLASFITGLLMLTIKEPIRGSSEPELQGVITAKSAAEYKFEWADLVSLFRIPSWRLLLVNELLVKASVSVFTGWNFTWIAGLGLETSIFYMTIMLLFIGMLSGNVFFGWLGDRLEHRYSIRGRITMVQIGLVLIIPTIIGYLMSSGENVAILIVFGFLSGSSYTAVSEGTLWPVAQAILAPELRGSNRAIISMIAGGVSAAMLALSGIVADGVGVSAALLWFVPLPILLSAVAWIPMFRTYPRDRAALHELLMERREDLLEQN